MIIGLQVGLIVGAILAGSLMIAVPLAYIFYVVRGIKKSLETLVDMILKSR